MIQSDAADARRIVDALARQQGSPRVAHFEQLQLAWRHLERHTTALIVLDLRLPGSRGLETLARLRMHDPHTPVVIVAGPVEENVERAARMMGALTFIDKRAADADELARLVTRLARGSAPDEATTGATSLCGRARDGKLRVVAASACSDVNVRVTQLRALIKSLGDVSAPVDDGDVLDAEVVEPTAHKGGSVLRRRRRSTERGVETRRAQLQPTFDRSLELLDEIGRITQYIRREATARARTPEFRDIHDLVALVCAERRARLPPGRTLTTDLSPTAAMVPDVAGTLDLLRRTLWAAASLLLSPPGVSLHVATMMHGETCTIMITTSGGSPLGPRDTVNHERSSTCAALMRAATRAAQLGGSLVWGGREGAPQWVRVVIPARSRLPALSRQRWPARRDYSRRMTPAQGTPRTLVELRRSAAR